MVRRRLDATGSNEQRYRDFIPEAREDLNGIFAFITVPPAPPFPEELHLQPRTSRAGSLAYFRLTDGDGATDARPQAAAAAKEPAKLPAVSGEGRLIVTLFVLESEEPVDGYLASVALDGSDLRSITKPPGGGTLVSDSAPALSPDGTTVAFQRAVARPSGGSPPLVRGPAARLSSRGPGRGRPAPRLPPVLPPPSCHS